MATIKDVVRQAGVSVATESRVINDSPKASQASQDAVHNAMAELRYHPNANARVLAHQHAETLGLVVADVSDSFFGAMVKAVDSTARTTGNFLLISNGYHDAKMLPDAELSAFMHHVPGMVLINRILPGFESRCVALDDRHGGWLATRHMLQEGHRAIAFLCSNHPISDAVDRLQGYSTALHDQGIALDSRLIARAAPDETGDEAAMRELLSRSVPFSAVVCYNDSMAASALAVLSNNGIEVPQAVSLIGFDDVLIARYLRPRLTTIRYPVITMSTQAAELAIALAQGQALTAVTNTFTPTLVRRHSVQSLTQIR